MIRINLNDCFRLRIMRTCILKRLPKLVVISEVIADGRECIKMKTHAGSAQNWLLLFIRYADWQRCCCRLKLRIWLIGQLIQACCTWGTRLRIIPWRLCKATSWNYHICSSGACFSKVPKLFGPISGATIPSIHSQRRGSKPWNFAILLVFLILNRSAFQNKGIAVWQLAFRARKVVEKRALAKSRSQN